MCLEDWDSERKMKKKGQIITVEKHVCLNEKFEHCSLLGNGDTKSICFE